MTKQVAINPEMLVGPSYQYHQEMLIAEVLDTIIFTHSSTTFSRAVNFEFIFFRDLDYSPRINCCARPNEIPEYPTSPPVKNVEQFIDSLQF